LKKIDPSRMRSHREQLILRPSVACGRKMLRLIALPVEEESDENCDIRLV
jgi:hypothetical protein